ncbi:MAG: NOB1 family endonuclease [Candidatus Heimdallarchaeota archaeon]
MKNEQRKSTQNKEQVEKKIVLDASAIYNGVLSQSLPGKKYLPQCTIYEIEGMLRGEAFKEEITSTDNVIVLDPEPSSITTIIESAKKTGDIEELSDCDIHVLALAFDLKDKKQNPIIISDDYDIQNLAEHLGLMCRGVHWKGITKVHEYFWLCTGCGTKTKEKQNQCIECGSPMKRKTLKKKIRK